MTRHAMLNLGLLLTALALGGAIASAAIARLLDAWWRRQDRLTAQRRTWSARR